MIRFFKETDRKDIVRIWQEAFGDAEKYILDFLDRFGKYMLVLENGKKTVSMLTLFPVKISVDNGRYVYAVATDKNFRNRGFAGELIEYAKRFIQEKNEKFLAILPQNAGLFEFYGKFGFSELKCAIKIDKMVSHAENSDFCVEKIDSAAYFTLREAYFNSKRYVKWDKNMLDYFAQIYNGDYIKLSKNGRIVACAFCYLAGEKVAIPELLTREDVIDDIGEFFGKKHIVGVKEGIAGEKIAMVYPESYSDCYFGIGMN
ncbi:MAG: GNAT family N-acetyltransferase [Clostridia bacterium]|nr:GNAT family N-acetyltransferase [Clostridia bacterium]